MRAAEPPPAGSTSSQGRTGRKPAGEGSGWISTGATSTDFRRVTEGCLVTYDRLHQNVNRATNWPDLGFVPAPLRVFTKNRADAISSKTRRASAATRRIGQLSRSMAVEPP